MLERAGYTKSFALPCNDAFPSALLWAFTPILFAVSRPSLVLGLATERFRDYYWLKEELVAFCRERGLPTGGAKTELVEIIGSGWRSGQQLRAFFQSQVGASFRFNQALVGFIRDGEGRTLSEALAVWRESNESGPKPLAEQFEYNRHTREYGAQHPGATQQEIQAAWWEKRSRPRSEWTR